MKSTFSERSNNQKQIRTFKSIIEFRRMNRPQSRQSNLGTISSPATRSVSRHKLRDLGNRLYEKGFNISTMPSVKRRASHNHLEQSLAVTLTSFERSLQQLFSRKKQEPHILKKQSTVFPCQKNVELKRSETSQRLFKTSKRRNQAKLHSEPASEFVSDRTEPTKYLIDKFSGKFNIDKRYNKHEEEEVEPVKVVYKPVQEPAPVVKGQSSLNEYIKLIKKKTMNIDEFLYLKKADYNPKALQTPDPYDLKVVDYQSIKAQEQAAGRAKEYFTISKKGLCHYMNNKPIEFMPLADWLAERQIYNHIKNLKFFNKFRKWKTVKMWKRNVVKRKIQLHARLLEQRLFFLNEQLRSTLLNTRRCSMEMSKELTFISTKNNELNGVNQSTFTLESFKVSQEKKRRDVVKKVVEYSKENRETVSNGFKKCLSLLRSDMKNKEKKGGDFFDKKGRTDSSNKANRRNNAYEVLGFVFTMKYEERSELRKLCSKFVRFSYLVDFIFQQSLGEIYDRSVQDFIRRLEQLHSVTDIRIIDQSGHHLHRSSMMSCESQSLLQVKLLPSFQPLKQTDYTSTDVLPFDFTAPDEDTRQHFLILYHMNVGTGGDQDNEREIPTKKRKMVPEICKKWLAMKPSCEDILGEINHCIIEGLNSLKHFKRWSKHQDMEKYVNVLEEWDDIVCQSWEVASDEYLNPNHLLQTYSSDVKSQRISSLVKKGFERLMAYIRQKFTPFLQTYFENQQVDFSMFSNPNLLNLSQTMQRCMQELEQQKQTFTKYIPVTTQLGMLKLDSSDLKNKLVPSPTMMLERIRNLLPELTHERTLEAKRWLLEKSTSLKCSSDKIEDYVKQINNLRAVQQQFIAKKKQIDNLAHLYQIMNSFKVEIKDRKTFEPQTIQAKDQLQQAMITAEENTARQNQRFSKQVCKHIVPEIQKSLTKLSDAVLDTRFLNLDQNSTDILKQLRRLKQKYTQLEVEKDKCIVYQKTLNLPDIDFGKYTKVKDEIESRISLLEEMDEWQQKEDLWMKQKLKEIKIDEVREDAMSASQRLEKLQHFLPENPISQQLDEKINRLCRNLPLVKALNCQHMGEEHWLEIRNITKLDLQNDMNLTLIELIELRVDQYSPQILEIAHIAEKEKELLGKYDTTEGAWLNLSLKIVTYKGKSKNAKEVVLLNETAEFLRVLDQLITDILAIICNKYSKSIRAKASVLKDTLKKAQLFFTEWTQLQEEWRFLDSLFSSIESKRVHQSGQFESIDKVFKNMMGKSLTKMKPLLAHKLLQSSVVTLEKICDTRSNLQQVYNMMFEYLNEKRKGFPRFYFIDNSDLMNLIYSTSCENIENMILKCFRGIAKVNFEGDRICSLVTEQGDIIKKNVISTVGEVDQIFSSLQEVFVEGVRRLLKNSKAQEQNRKKWINSNPVQSVMTIAKVQFTLYTQITISNQILHPDSLNQYFLVFCKDQQDFIRDSIGGTVAFPTKSTGCDFLTKFQLYLAQDIFHRDVLQQVVSNSVINTNQFLWQKHLRFYWDDTTEDMGVTARHLLHSMKYGSQFISWKERTVLTTSTEKMCLKILFAFGHGTNLMIQDQNTLETVIGLGASLGYNTHMNLCSARTSPQILMQFLTGVYNVGTWGTLVNVHMLTPDSLSFLAQTLENVHNLLVKSEKRKESQPKGFGFILTTEKGPAISHKLSDLYRIVSLSPMNLAESLRIKFAYLGFEKAGLLASKLAKTYEVITVLAGSSEISQRKFLTCIERVKEPPANPGVEIEIIFKHVLKWIKQNYEKSMFTQGQTILSEVFQIPLDPNVESVMNFALGKAPVPESIKPFATQQTLQPILQKLSLNYYPGLDLQICQLNTILISKKCTIVAGEASRKSSLINILSNLQSYPVALHFINQATIPTDIMFGGSKNYGALQSGTNGIISWLFSATNSAVDLSLADEPEKPKQNAPKCHDWLVIQGFEENYPLAKVNNAMMKYIINDRKLVYNEGQTMLVPNTCRTIIQSTNLHNLDPSLIAVSGILNVEWNTTLFNAKIKLWARHFIPDKVMSNTFMKFIEDAVTPLLNSAKDMTRLSELTLIDSFLILLEGLIGKIKEPKQLKNIIAFCAVWGLFSSAQTDLKPKIDFLIRKIFEGTLPSSESVFSYYYEQSSTSFKLFSSSLINHETIIPNTSFVQIPSNIHLRYLFDMFVNSNPRSIILLTGPENSCKTAILKHYFYSQSIEISNNLISFNLDMSPKQLKQTLLNKMDTFRKRVITSHIGFDETRIIIDDVWMKGRNEHVNLDLIRGIVDKRGIYCDIQWKAIKQLRLAIASRFDLSKERIARHCHSFVTDFNEEDIQSIFECLVASKLGTQQLRKASKMITVSTLNIYKKMSAQFPRFFSYRQINRFINALGNATIKDLQQLKRYWNFAMAEVFGYKTQNSSTKLQEFVGVEGSLKINNTIRPMFSSLGRTNGRDEEVKDIKRLMMIVNEKIELYNKEYRSMPVVEYVTEEKTLEHIVRLYRTIPLNNSIQFGAKNSGRTNVTKIVTYIRGYELRVMKPDQNLLKTVVQCQRNVQKGHCTLVVPVEDNSDLLQQVCEFFSKEFYENVVPALSQQNLAKNEALIKYCEENNIKNVIEFFKQQKGKNMHIVLLMSDKELLKELMESHPHVAQNFTIDYFGDWTDDILLSLAEVNLIDQRLSQKQSQQVRDATQIGSQIHREVNKYVQCSLKQYQDYIKLFVQLFQQLKVASENSCKIYQQSYQKAQDYIKNTEQSGIRIEWLRKQCTNMAMEINKMKQQIKAFDSQEVLVAMERMAALQREIDVYNDKLIEALQKRHSDIRKTVGMLENLDEQKVKALKNAVNPSMGITPILELLMVILCKEPDIKQIKEQLSNFKEFLANIKAVNARTLNSELIRTFRQHSKKEQINNEAIKKLPFGMEFLNVLIAIRNYITEKERNTEFNGQIKLREKELQSIKETYPDIGQKLAEMDRLQKEVDQINAKKSQYEKETMELSCRKMIQQKILQIVSDQIQSWNCQAMKYEVRRQGLATDILLMAAQFIYTGHLPINKRRKVINEVRSKLNLKMPVATIYEHLNVDVEALDSVTVEEVVFENMVIINNSIKTFLMIDPDRKASEWLKTYAKQIKSVHQEDPNFLSILSDSVTKGGHLVVEVNRELSPTLYGLVCRIDQDTPTIRINQTEVAVSDQFKLHISMGQPIELTQELLDLFAVVNFQLGEEAIDREVRISMLNKLNPQMLIRQPDIIKRKVALKNELMNQQRNLANLFHSQSKQQDISEKVIKDLELIKLRIIELRKNVREQEQALTQFSIPPVINTTAKAAHVFKKALELYCRTDPPYLPCTKVQSFTELIYEGVDSGLIKDQKSLFIYLFRHYSLSMNIVSRNVLGFLLALQLQCHDLELCHDIVTYHGEELKKRLAKRSEFSNILSEIHGNKWRELLLSCYSTASTESFLLSSKVASTSNILERIIIGRVADTEGEYQYSLFLQVIKVMLGEEYLEVTLPTQADIRNCGSEVLLIFEEDFDIVDYCRQEFPNFIHIRKIDQLQGLAKKGVEKPVILIDGQEFKQIYTVITENEACFKDQLILVSYFPGIEKDCTFNKIYLPSFDQLGKLSQKLLQQGGLQDKYSGSYYWQLHYLQRLLSHYCKIYGGNLSVKLDARLAQQFLPLVDNLALQTTAISKTLIRQETTYDESQEQWRCYNHILMEIFYGSEPHQRINLIKGIISKIAEQREYIIDQSALARRLTDSAMDEFLIAEESLVKTRRTKTQRKFTEQIKRAFGGQLPKPIQTKNINIEALQERLNKVTMIEKKGPKEGVTRIIENSKQTVYRTILSLREKLSIMSSLKAGNYSSVQLKEALRDHLPQSWELGELIKTCYRNQKLTSIVDSLLYRFKYLDNYKLQSTIELGCLVNPGAFLQNYLRQHAIKTGISYEQLVFTYRLNDSDKENQSGLALSRVQLHCAEWDKKAKCLVASHLDSEFGEMDICVVQKNTKIEPGWVKMQLYRQLQDSEALLELEMPVNTKQGKLRESCLYLK